MHHLPLELGRKAGPGFGQWEFGECLVRVFPVLFGLISDGTLSSTVELPGGFVKAIVEEVGLMSTGGQPRLFCECVDVYINEGGFVSEECGKGGVEAGCRF